MDATRSGGDGMPDEIPNDCGLPSTTVHTYILYQACVYHIFRVGRGFRLRQRSCVHTPFTCRSFFKDVLDAHITSVTAYVQMWTAKRNRSRLRILTATTGRVQTLIHNAERCVYGHEISFSLEMLMF